MNKVAIYAGENFTDEVTGFSPFECTAILPSRVIKAPVEGGSMSFDNKVRDPTTIKIVGKINLQSDDADKTVRTIKDMYHNRDFSFYSVSTKDSFFGKMILQTAVDKTSQEEFDLAIYELEFVEAMIVQGAAKKALDAANEEPYVTGYKAAMLITGG